MSGNALVREEGKMLTVGDAVNELERFAPPGLAAEWDNVGLLLGGRAQPVARVMTCLTVTAESAGEAVREKADLIVAHHPILFHGVKRLTDATAEGRVVLELARANVAVYSPHTAFDNTAGGINDILANRLGLTDVVPLRRQNAPRAMKIVVFVPDKDLGRVSDAMFAAGAGRIGQYRECSFRLAGTGTFFGGDDTNPTVGARGRREEVGEWRLEMVCPKDQLDLVLTAMRQSHSYEEPAFDVYPLHPRRAPGGDGRLGALPASRPLAELARTLKAALNVPTLQVVGDLARSVQRVAIVCGAGGELLADVARARADVFVTGELRFHDYLTARASSLALLLPGHYASERIGVEVLAQTLQTRWPQVVVWASREEHDPVRWH
jgi:dinuclear metal center YbgI/SA1388 family protein